jgi:hypothetical protein
VQEIFAEFPDFGRDPRRAAGASLLQFDQFRCFFTFTFRAVSLLRLSDRRTGSVPAPSAVRRGASFRRDPTGGWPRRKAAFCRRSIFRWPGDPPDAFHAIRPTKKCVSISLLLLSTFSNSGLREIKSAKSRV